MLVAGEGARTPSEHCRGTLELGTEPLYAHKWPCDVTTGLCKCGIDVFISVLFLYSMDIIQCTSVLSEFIVNLSGFTWEQSSETAYVCLHTANRSGDPHLGIGDNNE